VVLEISLFLGLVLNEDHFVHVVWNMDE